MITSQARSFFNMMSPTDQQTLESIIAQLRSKGMRKTAGLTNVIETLIDADRPLTIAEISERMDGSARCDPATVYRILEKLEKARVVRKLGMHERAMYFELLQREHHHDYLLCTGCGSITQVSAACPVGALERQLSETTGFTNLTHELVFYGRCPKCSQ